MGIYIFNTDSLLEYLEKLENHDLDFGRGDDTVTYSFATSLGNIPAQISYTDDGKTYEKRLCGD